MLTASAAMNINDAMDIVDIWGADPDMWPSKQVDDLKALYDSDEDFKDYVDGIKRIDEMLEDWSEGVDGVDVGDTEDDDDWGDDKDFDIPPETEVGSSGDEDDDWGDEGDNDEDDDESGDEQNAPVISLDPDLIKDMDDMFSERIAAIMQDACDDGEFRVFTRDYDRIIEIPGVTDQTSIDGIDQAVAKSTGPLQKDLRRMIAARSQVRRSPGMRSGRLHAPNLHRILSGDDRVFTRREEAQSLDTAISLVIDCSGSMAGDELNLATQTAYALGSVLSRLGIAFECLGFTDDVDCAETRTKEYMKDLQEAAQIAPIHRYHPIVMPRFKEFDERWSQPVQRRFAHVYNNRGFGYQAGFPFGSTPEGCGVEFAARRLLQRKEARKIMLVMTDGEPCGRSYSPGNYGIYPAQAKRVVQAVSAAGIDLVGIGIKHDGPSRYYPNHMMIEQIEEMPAKLLGLLKKFIVGK